MTKWFLAILCALLLAPSALGDRSPYYYKGVYGVQTGTYLVTLRAATVTNGHVAIWVGNNSTSFHWVQAGVAQEVGKPPYVYVETQSGEIRVRSGRSALVTIACNRYGCSATVDGVTASEFMPAKQRVGYMGGESWEPDKTVNHYRATVDSLVVAR
jgi:hypothetical protein